jgi:ParB family transcriptional regulator, chromosome partitioning protein
MAEKKSQKPGRARTKRRRKPAGQAVDLTATDLQATAHPKEVAELQQLVEDEGGKALGCYREPYGGRWVILAALPIEQVGATPYQRDISDTHVRKLETVIGKIGRFLDPIIVVRARDGKRTDIKYWTPNGHHRLSAMRTLGARSITALVIPEPSAAYQILALNTEKAHNLREKALEVIRMCKELAAVDNATEESYSLEFDEPP